jgi:hypothetical protein
MKNRSLELTNFLSSEKGLELIDEFIENERKLESIKSYWIRKWESLLMDKNSFELIIDKILAKYNSEEYINREYRKGYFPRKVLLWYIYEFLSKMNTEDLSDNESIEYSNSFTYGLIKFNGYIFNMYFGQSNEIDVVKLN